MKERPKAAGDRPWTIIGRQLSPSYDTGAPLGVRAAWYFVNLAVLYNPWQPLSAPRVWALRLFGARVGRNVNIKPQVKVKFPWKLSIGDRASIGEECWIDNLDQVSIGEGAMLSQRTYVCTGNHDWSTRDLPLQTAPVRIGNHAWIGAGAIVGPGAEVADDTVVTVGSVALGKLPPNTICSGSPAAPQKPRFPAKPR